MLYYLAAASAALPSCGKNASSDHGRLSGEDAEMASVRVLSGSATRAPFLMAGIWPRSGSALMDSVVAASGTQVTKISDSSSLAFSADQARKNSLEPLDFSSTIGASFMPRELRKRGRLSLAV